MILPWFLNRCGTFNPKSYRKKTVNICNSLIRGELSAIESYTYAIETFATDSREQSLAEICADHVANAKFLRDIAEGHGAKISSRLGPRGALTNTVEGAVALLGVTPALMVLQQSEEYSIRQYEKVLNDTELSEELRTLIRNTLLPA